MNVHDKCPRCGGKKTKISKVCQLCRANTELAICVNCLKQFHKSVNNRNRGGMVGVRGSQCTTCSTRCSKEYRLNYYNRSK